MVVQQPQEIERSLFSSLNTHPNYLCGRKQHGLGLQLGQALSPRILDSRGSNPIDQLARMESSLSGVTDVSDYEKLNYTDQNGQYDESVVYQQARWHPVCPTNEPCNRGVELVPAAQHSDPSTTHTGCLEHSSGSEITSTTLQKKSMADQATLIPENQKLVESNDYRPLC